MAWILLGGFGDPTSGGVAHFALAAKVCGTSVAAVLSAAFKFLTGKGP